ncbi:MAG: exopolysaccharide biosynthesis polyprenyl glycosylphosphotransferase, partial [Prevotellaceae bacterium]|nr:exopolysaccharide biosynthesis polyprenyl glycosylphosphotransferase [Prevotellaceae bacterium]
YRISRYDNLVIVFRRLFNQMLYFSLVVYGISGFKGEDLFRSNLTLLFLLSLFVLLAIGRVFSYFWLKQYRANGKNFRRVLFVDENENTVHFLDTMQNRKDFGLIHCGTFLQDQHADDPENRVFKYDIAKLEQYIQDEQISVIFFSRGGKMPAEVEQEVVDLATGLHIYINLIPNAPYYTFNALQLMYYDTFPMLTFEKYPVYQGFGRVLKRSFDVIFSLLVIVGLLSWLLPIVALAIIIDSGLPVFYNQQRVGLRRNSFACYKFRTMRKSDDNDIKPTSQGDSRITNLGKWLRKTSIDELPQFFNVLKGEMSVVGPRPHMEAEDEIFYQKIGEYKQRNYVKPGITGYAQIKGLRGEITCDRDIENRVAADVYYMRNWSLLFDISIIVRTMFKVVGGDKKAQ